MTTNRAADIFDFLRGALRATYGMENLIDLKFLVIGNSEFSYDLLEHLYIYGMDVSIQENNMSSYSRYFSVCPQIDIYQGGSVDVIINLNKGEVVVRGERFPLNNIISGDTYTQGFHTYYPIKNVRPRRGTGTKRRVPGKRKRDR